MGRILLDILIIATAAVTVWFVYTNYSEQVYFSLFGQQYHTIYIDDLAVKVSVADEPEERKLGLSGVTALDELEGKLFIFDTEDTYSMWMKDMLMSIDIVWIDNNFKIVHIEERVDPDTFPQSFRPDEPARFVLEVNSFFTETFKITEGDFVTLPPNLIPNDIKPDHSQ